MKLPHPIQYQGSKRSLALQILQYFPSDIETLIEPFAGSAAISIATAHYGYAKNFIINDLNKPLLKLLELIIEHPDDVSKNYEIIWNQQSENSVEHYFTIRDEFNKSNDSFLFLYLMARCAKGAVRYNKNGQFNQSPDKRRKGTMPQNMKKNIYGVSSLLKGKAKFKSMDYRLLIDDLSDKDLVYMDPPYQGVCSNRDSRYYSGIEHDKFVNFLEQLNKKKISYIISYDGRLGDKQYGESLPTYLNLEHIEINAGRSSQATLLGKKDITYESLYLSPALLNRISFKNITDINSKNKEYMYAS
ncbi:Dam family site-specific DNA-(adenine-N6)-methyltransferase [Sulfuricurvum sp.]|uniref:Dam family site-specific DNA-(adenine-N6)-methyltransferase n=1 Tax=Sulfuricurvum sp. TaxID=2025608 RepID=UPI003BB58458